MQYVRNYTPKLTPIQCVHFGSVVLFEGKEYLMLNLWEIENYSGYESKGCHIALLSSGYVKILPWGTEVEVIESAK